MIRLFEIACFAMSCSAVQATLTVSSTNHYKQEQLQGALATHVSLVNQPDTPVISCGQLMGEGFSLGRNL